MFHELAFQIAKKAHSKQVDKAGKDYILHPMKVASYMDTDTEKAVAYLHDVLEDTNVTEDDKLFISQIYSYILMGLMLDWIKDDMEPDPEEIVDRLATLIKDTIPEALKRFKV